ncbi:MAG: adenylate/guanylate cyclase domain-containing protein [Spirochaetia bacterium]|jgi:adenylate cyclase
MKTYEEVGEIDPKIEALWREVLGGNHHHGLAFLPGRPRCMGCHIPMKGVGGAIVQLTTGRRQSRKNPNMCNLCDDHLPKGGAEVDVAVLFADVRGSTGLAEKLGPKAFADLLNRFYRSAMQALVPREATIDKLVGDEVMALFFPNIGPGYREKAVHAAVHLQRLLSHDPVLGGRIPVGIGVNAGTAFCGRIGSGDVHDFTALGDTVNTGARLQAAAKAGEIVIAEELYDAVAAEFPGGERRTLDIRGREAKFEARVLKP